MQAERVSICSQRLMSRGVSSSWFVPLETDQTVDDLLAAFAQFLLNGSQVGQYPIIQTCFTTLLNSEDECMFVFMRRYSEDAVGILRSNKPLFSERENTLMRLTGAESNWNVPLWTWKESHYALSESMERQIKHDIKGPCFGVWCYR
jgi:hypothetical protein